MQLAEMQGWAQLSEGTPVKLSHAHFGLVLGADGKKLSSRDGVDLTLEDLLDSSVSVSASIR